CRDCRSKKSRRASAARSARRECYGSGPSRSFERIIATRNRARSDLTSPDTSTCSMPSPDQERLARILDDHLVAIERGLPVSPEELVAKYPEDAEQLRGYLSGLQLFHAAAPKINASMIGGPLPQPAQTLGDYQLVREIGRGGMGVVYEAWQLSLRRRVA